MANDDSMQVNKLWEKLLEYQTDFALPLELIFYYQSQGWLESRSVIELGIGNGYYLSKLIEFFPAKEYKGIDINPFYVESARNRFLTEINRKINISIELQDLFDINEKFDCVITRLVVQHLNSIEAFLQQAFRILNPGGTLLIIDSHDSTIFFSPKLPYMEDFLETLRKSEKKHARDRDAAFTIKNVADNFGLQLTKEMLLTIPSTISDNKEMFLNTYKTVFDIVSQDYRIEFDYPSLKQELNDWFSYPNSYTQIGLHIASYKRNNE